ncbi:Asp-tRNAAsn/Glu-tRNAGln amidotransferase A subunit or related amidase [Pseudomonas syringae pv. actinidiae]|uniref:Asp-tRNAAsn/Glu-tRNAGln amidotransferase A subunit or related amidase n=1 Tax=Pseudomonas syringae pv. actinidiae TaxID=103796 RepID=A0A2V0QBI6_PSESF|nr:Asp-tRNAAsn/Glu-tRNAGln amidotransferase A subunit or related amidase [Pseudomonas syringae pv. actinidiae]
MRAEGFYSPLDRRGALGKLDDLSGYFRLVDQCCQKSRYVIARDVAIRNGQTCADLARTCAIDQGAWPENDPVQCGRCQAYIGVFLDPHVILEAL